MSSQGMIATGWFYQKPFQEDISLLRAAASCLLGRPTVSVLFSMKNGESGTFQDQGKTHLLCFLVDPTLLSLTCLTFLYCRLSHFSQSKDSPVPLGWRESVHLRPFPKKQLEEGPAGLPVCFLPSSPSISNPQPHHFQRQSVPTFQAFGGF